MDSGQYLRHPDKELELFPHILRGRALGKALVKVQTQTSQNLQQKDSNELAADIAVHMYVRWLFFGRVDDGTDE